MNQLRTAFAAKYAPSIQAICKATGLFVSVMLAQALIESANKEGVPGGGDLAAKHNNFFGIKPDHHWNGERCTLQAHDGPHGELIPQQFCSFSSPEECFKYRIQFLRENHNYTAAGVFIAKTPEAQAMALQNAGYAGHGNITYAPMIIGVINGSNLKQYDV